METGANDNNPNVPGQDNGLNAWLDAQLNGPFDIDTQEQVHYAKRNSDNNKCYDIDDVPMQGPKQNAHPLNYDPTLAAQAKALINDDHISICSNTGIRIVGPRDTRATRARKTSPPARPK